VQERIAGCASQFLQVSPVNLGCLFHDPCVEQSNQSRSPFILAQPAHINAQRIACIAEYLLNVPPESSTAIATAAA
jgi:MinD-like ATPase involved in chromosome partitioning or flagellar assembly